MIVRVLALKLHDPSVLGNVVAELQGMVPAVRSIDGIEVRTAPEESLADIVVVLRFASAAALTEYQADPHHRLVSDRTKPACAAFLVVDLEV